MKKGSRCRKCYRCGTIVAWMVPDGFKTLPNFDTYRNRYCCKECKRILEDPKSFWEGQHGK